MALIVWDRVNKYNDFRIFFNNFAEFNKLLKP